jgi:hypothetical protein
MPRRTKDHFAPLRPIVQQLGRLTHDELRDLVDMLQANRAVQDRDIPKRYGLPPVDPEKGHFTILNGGWQYRDDPPHYTHAARVEFRQTYAAIQGLHPDARLLIEDMANELRRALQPVPELLVRQDGSKLAVGTLQTKYIYRKKYDRDLNEVVKVPYGPFLYYRYWTSSGDHDRRKTRMANEYIGKTTLALMFDSTPPGSEERAALQARIIAAHKAGTIEALMLELGLGFGEEAKAELGNADTIPNQPPEEE